MEVHILINQLLSLITLTVAYPYQQNQYPSSSGLQWYGDERQKGISRANEHEYDLIYDDSVPSECNGEIKAYALQNYYYFGKTLQVSKSESSYACQKLCFEHPDCLSVNYHYPQSLRQRAYYKSRYNSPAKLRLGSGVPAKNRHLCQLLAESQQTNPRKMMRIPGFTHYHQIRCEQPSSFYQDWNQWPIKVTKPNQQLPFARKA